MRAAEFEYPNGWMAALACKAAERQGRHDKHWEMFDRLQHEHMTVNRNISDRSVILESAAAIGLDLARFERELDDSTTRELVELDRASAMSIGVRSIPTLHIHETGTLVQNMASLDDMRRFFTDLVEHRAAA